MLWIATLQAKLVFCDGHLQSKCNVRQEAMENWLNAFGSLNGQQQCITMHLVLLPLKRRALFTLNDVNAIQCCWVILSGCDLSIPLTLPVARNTSQLVTHDPGLHGEARGLNFSAVSKNLYRQKWSQQRSVLLCSCDHTVLSLLFQHAIARTRKIELSNCSAWDASNLHTLSSISLHNIVKVR